MISLTVKAYCDNCAYFEPGKSSVIYADGNSYTEVMCENKRKCDSIEAYLRCKMQKEDHEQSGNVN